MMSNRREKEAGKERQSLGRCIGLPCYNVTHPGRLSDNTARKCSATVAVPCSSNKNRKVDDFSGVGKNIPNCGVSESETKKSGDNKVPSMVWRARASVRTKHTAVSIAEQKEERANLTVQKELRGGVTAQKVAKAKVTAQKEVRADVTAQKEARANVTSQKDAEARVASQKDAKARVAAKKDATARVAVQKKSGDGQVTRTRRVGKQPDSPAEKIQAKVASPPQVWREKAQPESSNSKELLTRKQQTRPPGSTSKQSAKPTDSSPPTNFKKSAIQKQVKRKETLPKDQSSKGKQVQEKQTEHIPSTSRSDLDTEDYYTFHLKWDGFDKSDNMIGVCCCVCGNDLGVAPYDSHDYGESEFSAIPVVAILHCGHSFHDNCLNLIKVEGQQGEPPCVFCLSFATS